MYLLLLCCVAVGLKLSSLLLNFVFAVVAVFAFFAMSGNVYLAREKASMKVLALKIMLKKDLEVLRIFPLQTCTLAFYFDPGHRRTVLLSCV